MKTVWQLLFFRKILHSKTPDAQWHIAFNLEPRREMLGYWEVYARYNGGDTGCIRVQYVSNTRVIRRGRKSNAVFQSVEMWRFLPMRQAV